MKKTLIATTSALALALSLGAMPLTGASAQTSLDRDSATQGTLSSQAQRILPGDESEAADPTAPPVGNEADDGILDEGDAGTVGDVPPVGGSETEAVGSGTPDTAPTGAPRDVAALPADNGVQPSGTHLSDDLDVRTPDGEQLASVSRYVFDDDGRITHVVVSFGGFLGFGSKEVMLPWDRFEIRGGQDPALILAISQEELSEMPDFQSTADAEAVRQQEQQMMMQQSAPPAAPPLQ